VRNRANTPPRDEAAFIHGGTAGIDIKQEEKPKAPKTGSKAKPVSISLAEENLSAIDDVIRREMQSGNHRVNRSDVVRAAVMGLGNLSKADISELIKKAKLK